MYRVIEVVRGVEAKDRDAAIANIEMALNEALGNNPEFDAVSLEIDVRFDGSNYVGAAKSYGSNVLILRKG
jgi:hypothetical protein